MGFAARAAVEYRLGFTASAAATARPAAVPTGPTAPPARPAALPAERSAPRTGPAASAALSAGPALPAGCGRLRAAGRGTEEALGTDRTLRRDRDRPRRGHRLGSGDAVPEGLGRSDHRRLHRRAEGRGNRGRELGPRE